MCTSFDQFEYFLEELRPKKTLKVAIAAKTYTNKSCNDRFSKVKDYFFKIM